MGSTTDQEKLEPTWEELLGSNNWKGLLEPQFNLRLRELILHCGDLCQAIYYAFNYDKNSRMYGNSHYSEKSFFKKLLFPSADDYKVYSFLYATTVRFNKMKETNWIGYIAVTTDAVAQSQGYRKIYVAFRGTISNNEWRVALKTKIVSAEPLLSSSGSDSSPSKKRKRSQEIVPQSPSPKVMEGWRTIFTSEPLIDHKDSHFPRQSVRTQLKDKIKELIEQYKDEKLSIVLTGHSLGGALAILAAFDLAENENDISNIPIAVFVFASPRVGNKAFNERLEKFQNLKVLHVKNIRDLVPSCPLGFGYVSTGIELVIDIQASPHLKPPNIVDCSKNHNLQALLHVVAGWNGAKKKFELKVKRSLALVNKSSDFLKDECSIPESWWVEKNKGMVLNKDGEWVLDPIEEDEN